MTDRISEKQLQALVNTINELTNNSPDPWIKRGRRYVANIGNYHLSHAYGGVSLHQMHTDGGGVIDVFGCGHVPKRNLYNRMHAFIAGLANR